MAYGAANGLRQPVTAPTLGTMSATAKAPVAAPVTTPTMSALQSLPSMRGTSGGGAGSSASSVNPYQPNQLQMAGQPQYQAPAPVAPARIPGMPYQIDGVTYIPQGSSAGFSLSGPAGGGQYMQMLQGLLGQINGYDPTGQINQAYDAQNSLALKQVGLQAEADQAGRGIMPGDAAGRTINARLTSEALAPLAASRAMALANAGQGKLQMLAGLLPGLQQADQMAQSNYWKQQEWAQAQQDRQQQLKDDALRRQWALEDRKFQVDQRNQASRPASGSGGGVSYAAPSYSAAYTPASVRASSGGGGGGGAQGGGGGYSYPINAPGSPGSYNFWDGFGQSFYGAGGPGYYQNAMDDRVRQSQIMAAGNYNPGTLGTKSNNPPNGMSQATNGMLDQMMQLARPSSPSITTPGGGTAAPIAGGAQLVFAPQMSGISVAGPMSNALNPDAYGGSWMNPNTAYATATGRFV